MNRLACLKSQTSRLQRSWTTSAKLNMARQLSTSDILPRVTVLHNGVLNLHVLIVEYYVGLKKQKIIPYQGMCISMRTSVDCH